MTTPLGAILTLIFAVLVLSQPRHIAALCIIAAVCYLTEGQPLNVGVFHFTSIRFVLLAGFVRVIARGEFSQMRKSTVDRAVVIYALAILIICSLRVGTFEHFIYQLGILYNVLLSYFVFRGLLREERDYLQVLEKLGYVIIPLSLLIFLESLNGRDLFCVFGGVSPYSWVRDGHVRAEGPFRNPITAGSFGATFALLFASLLFARIRTRAALVGVVASTLIAICSHSSGPFLGMVLGVLALACWPLRQHTRKIRWGIVAMLIGLPLIMKAPVWFLIGRASDVVGGGGYHRAELVDQFVRHFNSWWLMGMSDTHDWFPYEIPEFGGADLTNIFVSDGVNAGLIGLFVSIALVVCCFQRLGAAIKSYRGHAPRTERLLWGIGSTMVGSIGILFSTTYFDQMYVIWYFLLACIARVEVRTNQFKDSPGVRTARKQRQRPTPQRMPGLNVLPKDQ